MPEPLTAESTVGEWLDHPVGGPTLHRLLEENGQQPGVLRAVRRLRMSRLVSMSGGQMTREDLDHLVVEVNAATEADRRAVAASDVTAPEPAESNAEAPEWQERISGGRFTDRTVIVTGAGSGIGRATASRIAREGGHVVAVDIAQDRLDSLVSEDTTTGITAVRADITAADGVAAIIAACGERIDGLANVVGIYDRGMPLHETDDELWQRVFDVNVNGMFRLMRAVVPAMIATGGGSIVNVTSEAALRGSTSGTAYTASKHAVVGMTRSAAFLYGPDKIRVNAVAPGGVATGIEGTLASAFGRERLGPLLATLPSIAEPEHVAASITFLLSDDGVNVNGALLPSDGGWSVQ